MSTLQSQPNENIPSNILMLWEKLHRAQASDREEIFNRIIRSIEPFVSRYLRSRLNDSNIADELLNRVRTRLWNISDSFVPESEASWLAYVKKTADSCISNFFADKDNDPNRPPIPDEISSDDLPYIEAFIKAACDLAELHNIANDFWLGTSYQKVQLLGLQLKFQHGLDSETVHQLLDAANLISGDGQFETVSPDAFRRLAYSKLYLDGDRLASAVISAGKRLSESNLDDITVASRTKSGVSPFEGWTWEELRILLWKVRNGLMTDQILRFSGCGFCKDELGLLYLKFASRYPHKRIMARLLQVCRISLLDQSVLAEDGLWRRLAFEYNFFDELHHEDIQDRIDPPAQFVRKPITRATLNGWLSNGRLLAHFIAYAGDRHGA